MSISPRVSVPVVKHKQSKHSLDDLKKKRKKKKGGRERERERER